MSWGVCAPSPPAESGRGEGAKPEITPPVTKRLKCEGAQWTAPRPGLIWHAHIKHDRLFFMYGHNQLNGPRSWRAERRISHVGVIPSVTTRDHDSRHRAVREAATAQVALPAGQDSIRAAKVTAVLIIKRCRTVLTQRCRYITKQRGC